MKRVPIRLRICCFSLACLMGLGHDAHAQPGHRMHELAHKLARQHAQETTPKVYYRPFCRRSHYVTNPSAPCWN
jgi:hypothetical protein